MIASSMGELRSAGHITNGEDLFIVGPQAFINDNMRMGRFRQANTGLFSIQAGNISGTPGGHQKRIAGDVLCALIRGIAERDLDRRAFAFMGGRDNICTLTHIHPIGDKLRLHMR